MDNLLRSLPMPRECESFAIYPWQDIPAFNPLPRGVDAPGFAVYPPKPVALKGSVNGEPEAAFLVHTTLIACREWVVPKDLTQPWTWYAFRIYAVSVDVADRKLALALMATNLLHWLVRLHKLNYGQND